MFARKSSRVIQFAVLAAGTLGLASLAPAAVFTWTNGAADSTWNTSSADWTGAGSTYVNARPANTATFDATTATAGTVTVVPSTGTAIDVQVINFINPASGTGWTISGSKLTAPTASTITLTSTDGVTPVISSAIVNGSATLGSTGALVINVTKTGAGNLILDGANTYTGALTVASTATLSGNVLTLGSNETGSSSSTLSIIQNSTLYIDGANVTSSRTRGGAVTLATHGTMVFNGNAANDTIDAFGALAVGGSPNRGEGIIKINPNNNGHTVTAQFTSFSGTMNKSDWLFEGPNFGQASASGLSVAQIKFSSTVTTNGGVAGVVTAIIPNTVIHDTVSGKSSLAAVGSNGLRLLDDSNAVDYGNVNTIVTTTNPANTLLTQNTALNSTVSVNSLTIRSSVASGAITLSGTGSLTMPDYGATLGANAILSDGTNGNFITLPTMQFNTDDAGVVFHTIADLNVSSDMTFGWFVKANAGTLTLTGNNVSSSTINGGASQPLIAVTAGVLAVSVDGNLGATTNEIALEGGGLKFNATTIFHHPIRTYNADTTLNTIAVAANQVVDLTTGTINNSSGGGGGVTFTGPGTFRINSASTYVGPTRVTGGTLIANNAKAVTADTSVSGGAKFGINTGINLNPSSLIVSLLAGNSELIVGTDGNTGAATMTGTLSGTNGGTLDLEVNGTVLATDTLTVTGSVLPGGTWTLNMLDLNGSSVALGTPYTVLQASSSLGTSPTLVGNLTSGNFILDSSYHGNGMFWDSANKTLTVQFAAIPTEVPEPTSLGLLGLGAAALVVRRRR